MRIRHWGSIRRIPRAERHPAILGRPSRFEWKCDQCRSAAVSYSRGYVKRHRRLHSRYVAAAQEVKP